MLISVVGVQFGRFQSTLDIAAGDWTLEHCEVRADHATALAVRGAANVSARRCGIGGFPILDPGRMAANAVSGSGRSVCTLFACTLEITVNCGARFFGFAEGRILGCFLQINNIHVSVADTATCLVRLCTLDDVEGPRRAFYKDDSDGDMPVHAGALRLGGAGALTLSRNWMQGKLIWHLASNHTREGVKSIEEQTFETPLTAHLPPRSLLLEAWEEGVWVNGSMGQPHFFGPGEEDGLDDMPDPEELEATFRDQKSPLWRKVIQLMRRRGWGNDTGCLADPDTQVCSLPFLHEVMLLVDMLSGLNFDRALTAGRKALTRSLQSTKQRRRKKMTVQTSCFFRTKNAMTLWTPNWKREIFSILQRAHMYRSVRTRLKSPLSPFPMAATVGHEGCSPPSTRAWCWGRCGWRGRRWRGGVQSRNSSHIYGTKIPERRLTRALTGPSHFASMRKTCTAVPPPPQGETGPARAPSPTERGGLQAAAPQIPTAGVLQARALPALLTARRAHLLLGMGHVPREQQFARGGW